MGLFINDSQHPGVFKNAGELKESNQAEFRRDYLSELIKEQQISNKSFHRAIYGLRNSHNKMSQRQVRQWREIDDRLSELKELNSRHEKLEHRVMEWLKKLEIRNMKLQMIMRNEQLVKKDLVSQVENLNQSHEGIVGRLDQFGVINDEVVLRLDQFGITNEQMIQKLDEQHNLHKLVAEQISNIEETQKEVLNQVENQEGLMEKAIRQIDNVRSILYERTNYLEDKIEKVYNYTTNYFQKFKTSSGQQMTLVMKKGKDDDEINEEQ